jgi:5-methylcytosine-specific restriction endonuclease McrA
MQQGSIWYLKRKIRKQPKPTHCACCGKELGEKFSLDHFIPRALGGIGLVNNRWPLHQKCNSKKSHRLPNTNETFRFSQLKGYCSL